MKSLIFSIITIISSQVFAAPQLVCFAEDGSQIQATINDANELSDVRIQIREELPKLVLGARAALLDIEKSPEGENVKSMVISDSKGNILVAVASGAYVDRSGAYSLVQCEISY